jgi:uncharacterized protein YukE
MTTTRPELEPGALAASLFRLGADPAALARAAQAWRDLSGQVGATGAELAAAATSLLAGWAGPAADAYRPHHEQVSVSLTVVSTVAGAVGGLLDEAADLLRRAQDQLDTGWQRLHLAPLTSAGVAAATAQAHQLRVVTGVRLDGLAGRLAQQRARLWEDEVAGPGHGDGADAAWAGPELAAGMGVILDGDRVIVSGTGTGDRIEVGVEPGSGRQFVRVNGEERTFGPDVAIVVRAGGGADTVRVVSGGGRVSVLGGDGRDHIDGGAGDDRLYGLWGDDTILGGGGADMLAGGTGQDYLSGGAGDDRLDGGADEDILYGLDGADRLSGGAGNDELDGGARADIANGGRGDDLLIGGRGRDALLGGVGTDTLVGGADPDRLDGGGGADRALAQPDDDVAAAGRITVELGTPELGAAGDAVRIDPAASPEFRARVGSDLEALRSTTAGGAMFAALRAAHDAHGDTVTITETDGWPSETGSPRTGAPVGATVHYNPTFNPPGPGLVPLRPLVQLYHELAHAYDDCYDSATPGVYLGADNPGVRNDEREATGLPVDDDLRAGTPDRIDPDHPFALTENGLREDLGLPLRTRY